MLFSWICAFHYAPSVEVLSAETLMRWFVREGGKKASRSNKGKNSKYLENRHLKKGELALEGKKDSSYKYNVRVLYLIQVQVDPFLQCQKKKTRKKNGRLTSLRAYGSRSVISDQSSGRGISIRHVLYDDQLTTHDMLWFG